MTSAAPAILALETDSAWVVILAVSLITLVVVIVLHRLIGRPGGLASGILLSFPLSLPLVASFMYEQAVLPEISVLQPAGRAVLDHSESLMHLLLVDEGRSRAFALYALTGSAGPYMVLIGAGVTSFMLLRRLAGWLLLRRVVSQSLPLDPARYGRVLQGLNRLCRAAGVRRVPEVSVLPAQQVDAFTTGGRRPRILVSAGVLERLEDDEVEAVLAHELAHIRARDVQVVTAAGLFRDVVAWNPIAHIAFRRLAANRELEADRRAAEITGNPLAVASSLVKMCEAMRSGPLLGRSALAFLRPRVRIKRRVSALLALADGGRAVVAPSAAMPYALAALLAILLGLQAGAQLTNGDSSAFAIVIGSSEGAEPWSSPDVRAKLQHRSPPRSAGLAKTRVNDEPQALTPYAQVLAVRKKELALWRTLIIDVARRRGISPDEFFLAGETDLEAIPLVGSDPEAPVAIYRLKELR
ncbi:MAG: M56 family metallopeptidase [Actinomycetota bacterium]|nr:M56 family metallopeptidase [Actinomycetota bacterium]